MFFLCTLHKRSESYTTFSSARVRARKIGKGTKTSENQAPTTWPDCTIRSTQRGKHRGGAGATKHRIKQANKKGDQTNLISFACFMLASRGRGPVKPCG